MGEGISPSWEAERFPPGNTCAEGKELEVRTRWRRRISLEGEMRRMLVMLLNRRRKRVEYYLALGRGSTVAFLGLLPEDMYCFCRAGGAIFDRVPARNGRGQDRWELEDREGWTRTMRRVSATAAEMLEGIRMISPGNSCLLNAHCKGLRVIERHLSKACCGAD